MNEEMSLLVGRWGKQRKWKSEHPEEKESGQSKSEANLILEYSTFEDQHKSIIGGLILPIVNKNFSFFPFPRVITLKFISSLLFKMYVFSFL